MIAHINIQICVCFTSLPFLPYSKSSLPWKVKNCLVSFLGDPSYLLFSQKLAIERVQSQLYLLHTLTFPFFKTEFSTVVQHTPCSLQMLLLVTFVSWVIFYEGGLESFAPSDIFFIRVMKTE